MKKLFLFLTAVFCLAMSAHAQRTVTGTVVDAETDEPLVAATVLPIGGGTGTITDIDGNFSLNLPGSVKEIKFSYVGYATQTVAVSDKMTIALVPDNKLETVVVTGYGSGKKLGSIVGSVSVVGEEQFQNIPTATFVDALQGQVAGLSIYSNSGDPSSTDNSVRLRGVNSLQASTDPLYILDGAPVSQNVFTTLNPNDIESVTVLKDAASVAIYGSRAANGVIVITSKKGKFGEQARVTVRANVGWSQLAGQNMDMMNSAQYVKFRDMIGEPVSDEARYAALDLGIDTDWMKEMFKSHAPTYSVEAAVQGGTENTSYFVSLGHYAAEGIITESDMRRETLRVSLNSRVTPWFRIGLQANLGYTKYQTNSESDEIYGGGTTYITNPIVFARMALPYDSPYYYTLDENGKPVYGAKSEYLHFSQFLTPQSQVDRRSLWTNRVTANITLSEQLNPVRGLTIRAQQNVDAYDTRSDNVYYRKDPIITPMGDKYLWGYNPDQPESIGKLYGSNSQSFARYYQFTYTNTAEYSFTLGDVHNITLLAGQEAIIAKSSSFGVLTGGITDNRLTLLGNGTYFGSFNYQNNIDYGVVQSKADQVFNSFFFNGSYDYDNKYFFEATFRRDGSSKFAPNHRWASFWSVGGRWSIKNESFMQPATWVDDLSLHVSYGTTGNSGIGNYGYLSLIGDGSAYNSEVPMGIASPGNPYLKWETVKSFDLGLGYGFLNIFSGDVSFYNKNTVDMLFTIPYSYTTGFSGTTGNIGSMRNTGVDFDLQADIIKTRDWYWAIRGNFNYNYNRITSLIDGQDSYPLPQSLLCYAVGHDAGEFYMAKWAGVDNRDGSPMWYDADGNLTKVYNENDMVLLGKSQFAPYSGGFGTDLRWKTLSLRVDFNWAAKKYMVNNDRFYLENPTDFGTQNNMMTSCLDIWTTPGKDASLPAYGEKIQFDSHLIEDASFLRLKNLTLQYGLPQNILNKLHLRALNVHFTGRNLLTFTDFTGYDPEPETNIIRFFYPNTRQYEFGIEVSF